MQQNKLRDVFTRFVVAVQRAQSFIGERGAFLRVPEKVVITVFTRRADGFFADIVK